MANDSVVKRTDRVIYIEPNDVYGNVNGVPLAPNVEDFCISFDLIVEAITRYKPNITHTRVTDNTPDGNESKVFMLSWVSKPEEGETNWVSFLQGTKNNKYQSLTTYYTDISFENYSKNTVEGLGVESVDISFDSYYTPTVSIKFVDVRGSALFGREEAIHKDGEITADNVFGCFFTLPYPKFKLQVKGFYGKPVTFQLTCSEFKGEFNPKNGNFEATATFIGYSYSLLTDIPFRYLVAAPFCEYGGKAYWDSKINSEEWSLDGSPMITLYRLINIIDSRKVEDDKKNGISEDDKTRIDALNTENLKLQEIRSYLNKYTKAVKAKADVYLDYTNNSDDADKPNDRQILLMCKSVDNQEKLTKKWGDEVKKAFEDLVDSLNGYNKDYPSHGIADNQYPNGYKKFKDTTFTLKDVFVIEVDPESNEIDNIGLLGYDTKYVSTLQSIPFNELNNDSNKLNEKMAVNLHTLITSKPFRENTVQQYAYLINLGDLTYFIGNRIASIQQEHDDVMASINHDKAKEVIDSLPMKPTIGNIFKIIMAHLETFCHIISKSVEDINNSDRNPSTLGITIASQGGNTDVPGNISTVPPWPGLYNEGYKTTQAGYVSPDANIIAWPGDFNNGTFVEEEVIAKLTSATMMVQETTKDKAVANGLMTLFPILPCDMNYTNNPFENTSQLDISSLGGYLGIRAAQIFGIMFNNDVSSELISLIGKMDAYNYYAAVNSASIVESDIIKRVSTGSIADALTQIMTCNSTADMYGQTFSETGKQRHTFENDLKIREEYNSNSRCPMLAAINGSSNYSFVRYYNVNGISLVPATLDEYSNFKSLFDYSADADDAYYIPTFTEDRFKKANGFLHKSLTSQLLHGDEYSIDTWRTYVNDDMFNILTDSSDVSAVNGKYEILKNGAVNVYDYEGTTDFTALLDRVWYTNEDKYSNYFKGYSNESTLKLESLGYDEKYLLPDESNGTAPNATNSEKWITLGEENGISYNTEGNLKSVKLNTKVDGTTDSSDSDVALNDICIHQCKIYYNTYKSSIFGHALYYMQNQKDYTSQSESDSGYNERCYKAKALLFLHTLRYNFDRKPNFTSASKKCGTLEYVPYGYLLLLGGLLWRKRYIAKNDTDPIKFTEGSIVFKSPGEGYTLFSKTNGNYKFYAYDSNGDSAYNVSVHAFFGSSSNGANLDYYVSNRLIRLFENFCDNEFRTIISNCELTAVDGSALTAKTFVENIKSATGGSSTLLGLSGSNLISAINDNLGNFFGNYKAIYYNKTNVNSVSLLMNEDNAVQDTIKSLYYNKCVVIDTYKDKMLYSQDLSSTIPTVSPSILTGYVSAFATELENMVKGDEDDTVNESVSDKIDENRDVLVEMYYYIKNLYDKWFISAYADEYDVNKFFKNYFVFIDKFYVNIYNLLIINCDVFSDIYHARNENTVGSLFSVIGDLLTKHRCMFVALPDYVGFGGQNVEETINAMETLFTPMPYNKKPGIKNQNTFVTIYVGPPASMCSQVNSFKSDGFDLNDPEGIPTPFKSTPLSYGDGIDAYTRYGYNVPSFGVSFARQNQHIFKNISVNMNNPMATDISILTSSNVAKLGSSNDHKIMYYGQDIYNVRSNYSYECEVEMMGNAQIQPLMYFQLLNVPMWRGAYMIFNVRHTMTPGNMVTKFKGMKMSKYNVPYCSEYYTNMNYLPSIDSNTYSDGSTGYSGSSDFYVPGSYEKVDSNSVEDVIDDHICENNNVKLALNNHTLNPDLRALFNTLVAEIKLFPENKEKETWTIGLSSALRSDNAGSEHYYTNANAIDLQIMFINSKGKTYCGKDTAKMFKVIDLLVTNHYNQIGQLIFEGKHDSNNKDTIFDWRYRNNYYQCLHLSYASDRHKTPQIFFSQTSGGGNPGKVPNFTLYNERVPPEYKAIAKKVYDVTSPNTFKNRFIFYCQFSNEELETHFNDGSGCSGKEYTASGNGLPTRLNNPGAVQWIGYDDEAKTKSPMNKQWQGVDATRQNESKRFAVFKNMMWGARAMFLALNTQVVRYNKNTIETLINAYAPQKENDTRNYISMVVNAAGIGRTATLPPIAQNKELWMKIGKVIPNIEDGIQLTDCTLEKAYNEAVKYINSKKT